jgi:hypothetical protein
VRWQKLYNPMVDWLLRSPLHSLISSSTMLIMVYGLAALICEVGFGDVSPVVLCASHVL